MLIRLWKFCVLSLEGFGNLGIGKFVEERHRQHDVEPEERGLRLGGVELSDRGAAGAATEMSFGPRILAPTKIARSPSTAAAARMRKSFFMESEGSPALSGGLKKRYLMPPFVAPPVVWNSGIMLAKRETINWGSAVRIPGPVASSLRPSPRRGQPR